MTYSESLASSYEGDFVSEFFLKSSAAFEAAVKGYTSGNVARLLERRRIAKAGHLIDEPDEIELSVVKSYRERNAADELVFLQYSSRGYQVAERGSELLALRSHARRESVVIARSAGRVVGTVTVGIDSPSGLLVDESNRERVDTFRARGHRLGEVVRLAVDPAADSRRVLAALFNAAHGVMEANRLDHVFIEVNPRHVSFYKRALCFEIEGEERICPRVQAPSLLLRMRVANLASKIGDLERALTDFPLN